MRLHCLLAPLLGLSFGLFNSGCAERTNSANASATPNRGAIVVENQKDGMSLDADTSGKKEHGPDATNLIPGHQGNLAGDSDLTARIRQAILTDPRYSVTANNIDIMTLDGRVTLRGPVNSDVERVGLVTLAENIAGADNVQDQLEVKSNP
jgi:osmotically-inducible protein OsmY